MASAAECRDVAIGCAGRMMSCAGFMKERVGEVPARQCVLACALVIVELGELASRVAKKYPELKLGESEWNSIESARAGRSSIAPRNSPRTRVLIDIGAVEDRVLAVQAIAPEFEPEIRAVIDALNAFMQLAKKEMPDAVS